MDVDGDGDLDFLGSNQLVFWLECPDRPFEQDWTFRVIDEQILGSHCLTVADVDLDGKLDLVANSGRPEGTPYPNSIVWLKVPSDPKSGTRGKGRFLRTEMLPAGPTTWVSETSMETVCPTLPAERREEKSFPGENGSHGGNSPRTAAYPGKNIFCRTGNPEPPTFYPQILTGMERSIISPPEVTVWEPYGSGAKL